MTCECGCGTAVLRRFVSGHNMRGLIRKQRIINRSGYASLYRPEHPKASLAGYVSEHIIVAEAAVGRHLRNREEVHHVNGNRADNRGVNLVLCPNRSYHRLLHARARARDLSGHADWLPCRLCKQYDILANLTAYSRGYRHRACHAAYMRNSPARQRHG